MEKQTPWKPRQFRLTFHLQNLRSGQADKAVFDLPLQSAEADVVPKYMPYMGRSLSSDAGAEGDEEMDVRAYYYQHVAHDLPQALTLYHRRIDLDTARWRKLGMQPYNAYQWFYVYQVLSEMGRMKEAKAALLRAKADDDRALSPTETRAWIQGEMKKLGIDP